MTNLSGFLPAKRRVSPGRESGLQFHRQAAGGAKPH